MIRIAAIALAFALLAPVAAAQAKQVSGEWIRLGDVAPVSGDAAGILIGPAPPAGQTLSLDPAFIVSTAKSAGVLLAIPLDTPIMVTRTGNATQAPPANVARAANPARQIAGEASDAQVLVLVRDVPRGSIITDADLGWQAANPARAVRNPVDLDLAVGMEAKRLLKAGQPLQAADLKAAAVIRKGDPVTLTYATPGVKLTVDGVAQNEAAKGESVRVLNSYSKRTIEAVAHAPGEARVN